MGCSVGLGCDACGWNSYSKCTAVRQVVLILLPVARFVVKR